MNAPPVLRPLRAILQRRLQTITSRPVRTPYYVHASNKYRAQLRYNSSNSDQTPKSSEPAENSSSEHAIRSETATTTSPVEDVQATQAQAVGETTSAKVEYVSVPVPEEQEEVAELAIPRLDGLFVKSAFQRLKVADEEIQIGIAEAVSRQLEVEEPIAQAPAEINQETQSIETPIKEAPVLTETPATGTIEDPATLERLVEAAKAQEAISKPVTKQAEANIDPPASEPTSVQEEAVVNETAAPDVPAASAAPAAAAIPGLEAFSNATPEQIAAVMAHLQKLQTGDSTADTVTPAPAAPVAEPPKQQEAVVEPTVSQTIATEAPIVEEAIAVTEPAEQAEPRAPIEETLSPAAESEPVDSSKSEPTVQASSDIELDIDSLLEGLTAEALEQEGAYNSEVAAQNEIATKSVSESTKSTRSTQSKATSGVQQLSAEELAQRRIDRHAEEDGLSRMPRNVQAYYLQPLRRVAEYGIPSCDLQLRSYSIRPLEFFCDFALRAAYYLGLPAYGPVPLPKIIERWTVPKSNFIFKKSQENFERITRRRLIQIKDGNPETVQIWLAFLQKHQQAAVGLKANIWEFSGIDVAKELAAALEEAQPLIDSQARFLSQNKEFATVEKVDEVLQSEKYRLVGAQYSYKEVKLR